MKIRNINFEDIEMIAYLHEKTLKSPNSKIGKRYLAEIYRKLLLDPDIAVNMLAQQGDKIVGVITVTKDLSKTSERMKEILFSPVIFHLVRSVISGRVSVLDLLHRIRFERAIEKKFPKPYVSILTLFVEKSSQRNGVGKKLVETVLGTLKSEKIKKVYVDTLKDNKKALSFYESIGFRRVGNYVDSCVLEYKL